MWNSNKRTADLSRAELELREVFELVRDLKQELIEVKSLADDALLKAQISHCLVVVRKVGEDKIDAMDQALD